MSRIRSKLLQPQAVSPESDKCEPIMEGVHRGLSGVQRSAVPSLLLEIPTMRFHDGPSAMKDVRARCSGFPKRLETAEKGSQTDYRESEAQTSPWTPPYRYCRDESPEMLTLKNLKWGRDLPAGIREVEIINRMRMKRAWEAILPPMNSAANVKLRTKIISAIEIDDWNFREAEIQFIMDMRMGLMEELTRARDEAAAKRAEERFRTVENTLEERRDRKVKDIRRKLRRELRKLAAKHRGSSAEAKWLKKYDVTGIGGNLSLTKLGNDFATNRPRFVDKPTSTAGADYCTKTLLPTFEQLKMIKPKRRPWQLCERETRWTDEKLQELHAELKAIRLNLRPGNKKIELLKRKDKIPSLSVTPMREEKSSDNDDVEEAAEFLQKLIRGRAMLEDGDPCGKLLDERQRLPVLEKCTEQVCRAERCDASSLGSSSDGLEEENRTSEILSRMEGMTASEMMEFLEKEQGRLSEERRAHAFAMLAERERRRREAEASGRRELEEHRCQECDEMFCEMVKVNRESVQLYLEDVINEGIEWTSEHEAKEYISQFADSMDDDCHGVEENIDDEVISDMIHNFVLPEVDKQIARKKMHRREESYLRNAHAVIYDKFWEIPPMLRTKTSVDAPDDSTHNESSEEIALEEECASSVEWIRQQIIEGSIDFGESLSTVALDYLISRAVLSDSEKIVADLLDEILQNVGIKQSTLSFSEQSPGSESSYEDSRIVE